MAGGGFVKLPNGNVVVALWLPRPDLNSNEVVPEPLRVRVLAHAPNRTRALTRLRNLGLKAVYLRGNPEPPTDDEVTAVLHHPDGAVWRADPDDRSEPWHPISTLLSLRSRTAGSAGSSPVAALVPPPADIWTWEDILASWAAAIGPRAGEAMGRGRHLAESGHHDDGCEERR